MPAPPSDPALPCSPPGVVGLDCSDGCRSIGLDPLRMLGPVLGPPATPRALPGVAPGVPLAPPALPSRESLDALR